LEELSPYLEEAVLSWVESEKFVAQELMFWQVALYIHAQVLTDEIQTGGQEKKKKIARVVNTDGFDSLRDRQTLIILR